MNDGKYMCVKDVEDSGAESANAYGATVPIGERGQSIFTDLIMN